MVVPDGFGSPPAFVPPGLQPQEAPPAPAPGGDPIALTDIVFTEILQGFRSDRGARLVERHLKAFPVLRLDGLDDLALAAELYRRARVRV